MSLDTLRGRLAAYASAEHQAERRERNRREMPQTAAILDSFRSWAWPPAYFKFTESGRTVEHGKPLADRK